MANELRITTAITYANGSAADTVASSVLNVTQATLMEHATIVSVGTSEEDMPIGDVGTMGWLWMKNLDPANYVTWGPKSAGNMVAMGRLEAGEFAMFRMDQTPAVLRWAANTAAVKVQMKLFAD